MGRTTDLAIRLMTGTRARPPALASRRPPAGATDSPTYGSQPHQPLWPSYEGPNAVAMAQRSVYTARSIEYIADSISGLPFLAGNMTSRTPRPTTRLQQLLGPAPGGPNPLWSAAMLWRYSIIQYLCLGKWAWLHEFDDQGRIVALWPLMAQHLVPVVAPPGAPDYFESFRYGTRGTQGYREFKPHQITYVWRPSQADIRQPEAPLRLANAAIVITQLLNQYDHAFLSNGGVPAHLVVTPPFEDSTARRGFRDQFNRKFGGASNAGKVAFAETTSEPGEFGTTTPTANVDVKVIGTAQKDAEINLLRQAKINDQNVVFGVALSLLGVSSDSKYTNMQTDRENYWQGTGRNFIREFEDHVNTKLAPLMDGVKDIGWFDTSNVPELRKPPLFTEDGGIAAVGARLITRNEYRADRGLPPVEGGDEFEEPILPKVIEAVEPANPEPVEPPAKDKPIKLKAVRMDVLDVVRGQLAIELADQRRELELRRDGKRGGRNRAHAALSLALVYDREHWAQRMARNLGPALRTAGYADGPITEWSQDVTSAVFEALEQGSFADVFEPDAYMDQLANTQPGTPVNVDAGYVESALLQISQGQLRPDDVIKAIAG